MTELKGELEKAVNELFDHESLNAIEVGELLGITAKSASAAISELRKKGRIERAGIRREGYMVHRRVSGGDKQVTHRGELLGGPWDGVEFTSKTRLPMVIALDRDRYVETSAAINDGAMSNRYTHVKSGG